MDSAFETSIMSALELQKADKWTRVAGYLIDLVPALLLGLVAMIPIVGLIFAGLLLTPYWLLRDVTGNSLGKLLLGMKVVQKDGTTAPIHARIIRNLPLAAAPIFMIIPLLGYVLAPAVAFVAVLVEIILLFRQGSRLGDRIAGTDVVMKGPSV